MSKPFIFFGDRIDHGGVVVSASARSACDGKGIARVGDRVSCPRKAHGVATIVSGAPSAITDGQPAACHSDRTACGAMLVASQRLTTD